MATTETPVEDAQTENQLEADSIWFLVCHWDGHRKSVRVARYQRWETIKKLYYNVPDEEIPDCWILFNYQRMHELQAVGEMFPPGDNGPHTVQLTAVRRLRKPVIYVWTPEPQEVEVDVALVPQWKFSVVYPISSITPAKVAGGEGQRTSWRIKTRNDGTLLDKATGLEVSCLFWEAETTSATPLPDSPPVSRPSTPTAGTRVPPFCPIRATLTDADSIVMRVVEITPYLDACLKALGLHIEARTSFITYWLPDLLRHEYVALRFVPQSSYEQAAPMTITPTPDVVVRVFMLFKGVPSTELGAWTAAQARAIEDVSYWRDVVGLDAHDRLADKSLFRVLEWGAMEVTV